MQSPQPRLPPRLSSRGIWEKSRSPRVVARRQWQAADATRRANPIPSGAGTLGGNLTPWTLPVSARFHKLSCPRRPETQPAASTSNPNPPTICGNSLPPFFNPDSLAGCSARRTRPVRPRRSRSPPYPRPSQRGRVLCTQYFVPSTRCFTRCFVSRPHHLSNNPRPPAARVVPYLRRPNAPSAIHRSPSTSHKPPSTDRQSIRFFYTMRGGLQANSPPNSLSGQNPVRPVSNRQGHGFIRVTRSAWSAGLP